MALHLADDVASTVTGGGNPPLSLISQNLLETASYERSGADLVLVSEDGERLTVSDYFASPSPPDLMADNGAFLSGATVSLLAGGGSVQVAQAGAANAGGAIRIGLVETLTGTATAQHPDGSISNLKTGDPVFQGDVVKVSADGKLGLSFLDKSVFSLSGGGTMTLNEMIYNPGSTTNKMVFGLVNGSLSFVTGAVAPSGGVTIETPVAVMAIRGTIPIALDVGGGKYLILAEQGHFEVIPKLPGSPTLTIDDSGKAIYFPFGLSGAPQVIDLAGSGLEDDVALLVRQLNEARQEFLQRRADATGSPDFAEYESFAWIEGETILTQISGLLSPLLEATQFTQSEPPPNEDIPSSGTGEDAAADVPSVVGGTAAAALTETDEAQSASGTLTITDGDDPAAVFVAQADVPGSNGYGTFSIDADGHWTYVMSSAQDRFVAGQDYTDQITVTTTDGTTQVITVTITGTDDGAVVTGTDSAALTETDEAQSTGGTLNVADADDPAAAFVAQADVPGSNGYGTFSIDADGHWTYVMSSAQDSFVAGQDYTDQITVTTTDGTTQVITVTITGSNDAPSVSAATDSVTEGTVITGTVSGSDPDAGETAGLNYALVGAAPAGLTFNPDGSYSFDAASYDALAAGEKLQLTITFTATDAQDAVSAPANLVITVTGTNDGAEISGVTTGSVTEDVAVTDGTLTASGSITILDADDGEAAFVAQAGTAGTYGTFSLAADGNWTYTASNDVAAIQQLGEGKTLTETFTAVSADGTTQEITITINGTNDVPEIGGVISGSVTEDLNVSGGNLTASGSLTISDADAGESVFIPQTGAAGSYGSFTLLADGSWTYVASNGLQAIQQLGEGETLTETFTAVSADGTTQDIMITINGTNDVPEIGGTSSGSITEDASVNSGNLTAGGSLTITDADTGESVFVAQANTAGSYGIFTLLANGSWTYIANNGSEAIQQLGSGDTLTETFTATSADGTTQEITITINGTNDVPEFGGVASGSVTEDVGVNGGNLTAGGSLTITDADTGESVFIPQTGATGSYGSFTLLADGSWTYVANNGSEAIQQLGAGDTLTETFTATSADGTTQEITITINGTNDVPDIGGTSSGGITEDAGVNSGNLTASGSLTITDPDSGEAIFIPQTGAAGSYGSFTLLADGSWTYVASNGSEAIQQLGSGYTLTETFTATTADGTTQTVIITLTGTNDVPEIGGTISGSVTEDLNVSGGNLTASGSLTISDPDSGEAIFSPQTDVTGSYGDFTLLADGSWTYFANNGSEAIQQLGAGDTLTETFTATSADGTTQEITITINGTNDVPEIGGTSSGGVTEDLHVSGGNLTASGRLTITDADTGESVFIPQTGAAGSYGSFTLLADGSWTYVANNGSEAIQQLGSGDTLTETFTATSADGTTQEITITINGTNDVPEIGGTTSGSVTEDVGVNGGNLTASGSLTISDADSGESVFIPQTGAAGSHGIFSLLADGSWTYVANNGSEAIQQLGSGDTLTETFTATSADGTTQEITITLNGTNDVPEIGGVASGSVTEDVNVNGGNLAAGGSLTISDADTGESVFIPQTDAAGSYGSFTLLADGSWTYVANNGSEAIQQLGSGDTLTETFTAVSADGTTQEITITINGTNDGAVIGGASSGSVTEDLNVSGGNLTASGNLSITDADTGESVFVAQANTVGSYGIFTLLADGSWTYVASNGSEAIQQLGAGDTLTETFTAVSADGTMQEITITINGTNDSAIIAGTTAGSVIEDLEVINENLTASGTLTISDADAGEAVFLAQASTAGSYGHFTLATDGTWTYVADNGQQTVQQLGAGDTLTETFTAVSADGTTQEITITINGTNDVPEIGGASSGSVTEDAGVNGGNLTASGSLTISDADTGESVFISQTGATGSYGHFTLLADGSWTYVASNGSEAIQQLGAGDTLTETFTAVSGDGTTQEITITINGTNDVPEIGGTSSGSVTEDLNVSGEILTASGSLTITDPDSGESVFIPQTGAAGSYGSFTLLADGSWTYVASNGSEAIQQLGSGDTLTETFTAVSADGTTQDITITINGTNDAPEIDGTSSGGITEDVGVNGGNLTASGSLTISDPDSGESVFIPQTGATGSYGSFTLLADGSWTYVANNGSEAIQQLGSGDTLTETFTATSADGTTQDITITINGTNDVPEIGGTSFGSVTEDASVNSGNLTASGSLTISDADTGESVFIPQTGATGSYGSFTLLANGSWTYVANNGSEAIQQLGSGDTLTETFTAISADGTTQEITITINGTNDVPEIGGTTSGSVTEDVGVNGGNLTASGSLTITDPDSGEAIFIPQTGAAGSYGSFTLLADGSWTYFANNGSEAIQQLGAGDTLTETFTATSADGTTQEITITINGTNDVPEIGGVASGIVTEDVGVNGGNLTASGSLTITDPDSGEAVFVAQASTAGSYGSFTLLADGSWTYVANNGSEAIQQLGSGDTLTETFTATSADGTTQEITITINGTNDVPEIGGVASVSVTEDTNLAEGSLTASGNLSITDADTGESVFIPQTGAAGSYGIFTLLADGSWTYVASNGSEAIQQLGAGDTLTETFTATSADGTTQDITITINGTNDGAVIGGDITGSLSEDGGVYETELTVTGVLTVSDADAGQSAFVPQTDVESNYGVFSLTANGNWTYAANNDLDAIQQLGPEDTLTDTVTVSSLDGTTQVITITITGTNDAAVIGGVATGNVTEDIDVEEGELTTSGTLTISDADAGDASFVAQNNTEGLYGVFNMDSDGNWTYAASNSGVAVQQLGSGDTLSDAFNVTSADGTIQQVTITITGTNDVPVAEAKVAAVAEDATVSGSVAATDADAGETASLTYALVDAPPAGLTFDEDGSYSFDAASYDSLKAGETLVLTVAFTATDAQNATSAPANLVITLTGRNDVAEIGLPTVTSVTEDTGLVNLTASGTIPISDPDMGQNAFQTTVTGGPGNLGSLSLQADGSYTYSVANSAVQFLGEGQTRIESFTITSADGTTGQVSFTINGTNDGATISGVTSGAVQEDAGVVGGKLVTAGNLTVNDPDALQSVFVAQENTAGTYGTFSITAAGAWAYSASNAQAGIQSLGASDTATETFTVASADGTTQEITITIQGTNDGAVIAGDTTGHVTEDMPFVESDLMAFGTLTVDDADSDESSFIPQTNAEGAYGVFSLDAAGAWTYAAFDGQDAIQELPAGETLTDSFTVTSADGTEQVITITITGTNDAAQISGDISGSVTEDVGVVYGDGAEGEPYGLNIGTSGQILVNDVDAGEVSLVPQTLTAGSFGSFTLDADGNWIYTANNDQEAIQQLGESDTLTDTFTVTSADGTEQVITVTINGTNDVPQIGGDTGGSITEDVEVAGENGGNIGSLSTSGILTIIDADSDESAFAAQTGTAGNYGSFSIDAMGAWSYAADNGLAAIQELGDGGSLTDTFTVSSADGTTQEITITINGSNDVANITGDTAGSVTEDVDVVGDYGDYSDSYGGSLTATGTLTIDDADAEQSAFVAQYDVAGSYGSFTLEADGSWTYTASNYQDAIQELGDGDTLTETFTVTSVDGTTSEVTITINGSNDVAYIYGESSGSVTEDGEVYANGRLNVYDGDAGESEFTLQANVAGNYGTFSLDADGSWTYTLDNTNPDVQALNDGETLTDSFTAVSADQSSSQQIEITINGETDAPVLPPPDTGDDDPNNYDDLGNVAIYEPELTFESGNSGRQTWNGTDECDEIGAGESDDTAYGHGGDDVINGNGGNDTGNGGGNGNGLYGQYGNDTITGGAGKDQIYGGSGDDVIYGGTNPYTTSGPSDQDALYGGSGSDTLYGQDGDDDLIGGYGADTLYGGSGKDNFIYLSARDTGDTIEDFVVGQDNIDLTALLGAGNLDSAGNTGTVAANSFNWYQDGANTIVTADVTGDTVADFAITLKGVDASDLHENSFAH